MRKIWIVVLLGINVVANAQSEERPVTFKIKNFGVTVDGTLGGLKGEIEFDPQYIEQAYFNVTVDVNSIDTGIELRDKHLKKEEYLDTKNYPVIRFTSTKVSRGDKPDFWRVTGKLSIKKVEKEISFLFYTSHEKSRNFLNGEFTINRRDFGVGGKSISMADELRIFLHVNY